MEPVIEFTVGSRTVRATLTADGWNIPDSPSLESVLDRSCGLDRYDMIAAAHLAARKFNGQVISVRK